MADAGPEGGLLDRYLQRTPGSAELFARAGRRLPGGIVTDTRAFDPYGIYVARAEGVRKWDVDGNVYLDFFGGHGANMLGHSPPVLVEAVQGAVLDGVQYAANHPWEVRLAEEVCRLVPSAERVRFTGSGTEATLLALRLARAWTGRSKILRFASQYHGWHDHAASGYQGEFDGRPAPGILPEIAQATLLVRPGDREGLARAFAAHGREIAAVIAEPLGTHFGVVPVDRDFLRLCQAAAEAHGALFVLDEVLSGFRVALGGAQAAWDLRPDLTTLAKVLCGGMPGGAVAGRADVLSLLDTDAGRRAGRAKVLHQGTFTANPVSMRAGLAVLGELERVDGCTTASALGALARDRLNAVAQAAQAPFAWYGDASIFHLFFREDGGSGGADLDLAALPMEAFLARPQPLTNRLRMALNLEGVDVNTRCSGLMSAAHTPDDVEVLAEAMARAIVALRAEGVL